MNHFKSFPNQTVMIFGDIIADVYQYGVMRRLSREAPIPIVEFESERVVAGGAGNVAANIAALQGKAFPVCVLGKDSAGEKVASHLTELLVDTGGLILQGDNFTVTKTRVFAQGDHTVRQQIFRLDKLPQRSLDEASLARLWDTAMGALDKTHAVIFSDYHLPTIPVQFWTDLAEKANRLGKLTVVDSRRRLLNFKNVGLMTPNRAEAEEAVGRELRYPEQLRDAGVEIMEKTGAKMLLITLGDEGMALFNPQGEMQIIPAHNRLEVFDVSGAGDTVVAGITLSLLAGITPLMAAAFANIVAGLVVRKIGTATVSLDVVMEYMKQNNLLQQFS